MRIAVNFPYFIPYSGYFRLFSSTDVFVIFDCVPFPRRGYVHRNQLPNSQQKPDWLTLPLIKAKRDTLIKDMQFVPDITSAFAQQIRRFPILQSYEAQSHPLLQHCRQPQGDLVDFLTTSLSITADCLALPFNVIRSSSLPIDPALRGENRVLAIVKHLGGDEYINAPGGRHLYDKTLFQQQGVQLNYLDFYQGNNWSILYRLLTEPVDDIKKDILKQRNLHG